MMNTKMKGYLFAITSAVMYGCTPLLARFIYADGVNSLSLVFLRNLLSIPMLGILAFRQSKSLKVPMKALPTIALAAVMVGAVTPLLLYSSYLFIDSSTSTVFHFIYPAAVVLGGVLFLKERAHWGTLLSVLLCVVGVCLFYTPGEPLDWRGVTLALTSGITYAVYIMMLSAFKYKEVQGFLLSFYIACICAVVMLAVCLVSNSLILPKTPLAWGLAIVFAFSTNVVAMVLFQQGAFLAGGQQAAILSTMEPITSILVDVCIFHVVIGPNTIVGSMLVLAATVMTAVIGMRKKD